MALTLIVFTGDLHAGPPAAAALKRCSPAECPSNQPWRLMSQLKGQPCTPVPLLLQAETCSLATACMRQAPCWKVKGRLRHFFWGLPMFARPLLAALLAALRPLKTSSAPHWMFKAIAQVTTHPHTHPQVAWACWARCACWSPPGCPTSPAACF